MHVGMAAVFQNPGKARSDRDVYVNELRLADLAEPLGFQSIWGVEHHFTDYTMCPDVLQFLTYMAGRTQHTQLACAFEDRHDHRVCNSERSHEQRDATE